MTYSRHAHATQLCVRIAIFANALICTACFDLSAVNVIDAAVEGGPTIEAEGGVPTPAFKFGAGITDLAANAERLFWIEYGTFDALGNYQQNGALRSAPLGGGPTTTHTTSLSAPTALWVTMEHAFVYLERRPRSGGTVQYALLRVALDDGAEASLETSDSPLSGWLSIATTSESAYWRNGSSIQRSRDDEASPELVYAGAEPESVAYNLLINGEQLYFTESSTWSRTIRRMSLSDLVVELLDLPDVWDYVVSDDARVFFVDHDGVDAYLASVIPGFLPSRVALIPREGNGFRYLTRFGDRLLVEEHALNREPAVSLREFETEPPYASRVLLQFSPFAGHAGPFPGTSPSRWVPTERGVFHTDGARIDLVPW